MEKYGFVIWSQRFRGVLLLSCERRHPAGQECSGCWCWACAAGWVSFWEGGVHISMCLTRRT